MQRPCLELSRTKHDKTFQCPDQVCLEHLGIKYIAFLEHVSDTGLLSRCQGHFQVFDGEAEGVGDEIDPEILQLIESDDVDLLSILIDKVAPMCAPAGLGAALLAKRLSFRMRRPGRVVDDVIETLINLFIRFVVESCRLTSFPNCLLCQLEAFEGATTQSF